MESKPLLPKVESDVDDQPQQLLIIDRGSPWRRSKCIIAYGVLLLTASVLLFSKPADAFGWPFLGQPTIKERASSILSNTPLIDGHNDLAILIRERYNNHIYDEKFQKLFSEGGMPAHVDLPRLKEGKVGGAFWSAFMPCPKNGSDFSNENYAQCKLSFFNILTLILGIRYAFSKYEDPNLDRFPFNSQFYALHFQMPAMSVLSLIFMEQYSVLTAPSRRSNIQPARPPPAPPISLPHPPLPTPQQHNRPLLLPRAPAHLTPRHRRPPPNRQLRLHPPHLPHPRRALRNPHPQLPQRLR